MKKFLAVLCACCWLCPSMLHAQAPLPAASASQSCPIRSAPPNEADLLLGRGKNKEAQAGYQAVLQKAPTDEYGRLGLIRSMLEQNQVAGADREAASFLKERPGSGLAQLAAFEVSYRSGDINGAFAHVKRAVALAPCEGQADMGLAQLYDMTGLHATAAHFIWRAHLLDPGNQFITREWIGTLPRGEQITALTAFIRTNPAVSDSTMRYLKTEEDILKARKPGECRVVSATSSAQAPLTAIFGRNTRPLAYGLEVAFNDKKRRMQIDTGASGILLTEGTARSLGLEQEVAVTTGGLGDEGARDGYLSHVHSMRIGAVELQDCVVRVVKESSLISDGLIGMDVFRHWMVTLDYPAAQLRLTALAADPKLAAGTDSTEEEEDTPRDSYVAPDMQDWLRIARIGKDILLPASLKPTGNLHYMILDTGAQNSMVSLEMGAEAGQLRATSNRMQGLSGAVKTLYVTQDTPLYIGSLHLLPDSYHASDLGGISAHTGFEVGGFFGLNTLQRLTIQIDYRDNLVKLTYDPKHDVVRF